MLTLIADFLSIFVTLLLLFLMFKGIFFFFKWLSTFVSVRPKNTSRKQKKTSYDPSKTQLPNFSPIPDLKSPLTHAELKGKIGEAKTLFALNDLNFSYQTYQNIILPKNSQETTEIDLILLTPNGIVVIENKNFSGYIFGQEDDFKWCQAFQKKKFFFYNPIKQNETHIRALSKVLSDHGIFNLHMISVICFNNGAELKKVPQSSSSLIVTERVLAEQLNRRLSLEPVHYTNSQLTTIGNIIAKSNLSKTHRELHIQTVRSKYLS